MYKFLIESEEQSIKLQKVLFKCGYRFHDKTKGFVDSLIGKDFVFQDGILRSNYPNRDYCIFVNKIKLIMISLSINKSIIGEAFKLLTLDWLDCFDDEGDIINDVPECDDPYLIKEIVFQSVYSKTKYDVEDILKDYKPEPKECEHDMCNLQCMKCKGVFTPEELRRECDHEWTRDLNDDSSQSASYCHKCKVNDSDRGPLKPVNDNCLYNRCWFRNNKNDQWRCRFLIGIYTNIVEDNPAELEPYIATDEPATIEEEKYGVFGYKRSRMYKYAKRCQPIEYGDEDE